LPLKISPAARIEILGPLVYSRITDSLSASLDRLVPFSALELPVFLERVGPAYTAFEESLVDAGFISENMCVLTSGFQGGDFSVKFARLKREKLYEIIRGLWRAPDWGLIDLKDVSQQNGDSIKVGGVEIVSFANDLIQEPSEDELFQGWTSVATLFSTGKISRRAYTLIQLLSALVSELEILPDW
jgi:hypothetical protein